ncbi:MAG TPA: glycosyltransferase [Thiobacillus sp.]
MIQVAALTQGRFIPAARFRVRQNISKLKELGINVSEYFPEIDVYKGVPFNLDRWPRLARFPIVAAWQGLKIGLRIPDIYPTRKYHITWLQRELLPGYFTLERMVASPIVFDVDDAIWLTKKGAAASVSKIASLATTVIAGNRYIAEWFSTYSDNVVIIPTAVDVSRFFPVEDVSKSDLTIGWIGTKGNMPYLEEISPALKAFFKRYNDVNLLVVSDSPPKLPAIPENRIRYIPWSESVEVEAIRKMDVGIMPLPDNEWTRGKCSFKMLQYMACGIPVVVAPVGMNSDLIGEDNVGFGASSPDEWFGALEFLYQNRMVRQEMGMRGRDMVVRNYSTEVVSGKIAEAFKSIG